MGTTGYQARQHVGRFDAGCQQLGAIGLHGPARWPTPTSDGWQPLQHGARRCLARGQRGLPQPLVQRHLWTRHGPSAAARRRAFARWHQPLAHLIALADWLKASDEDLETLGFADVQIGESAELVRKLRAAGAPDKLGRVALIFGG